MPTMEQLVAALQTLNGEVEQLKKEKVRLAQIVSGFISKHDAAMKQFVQMAQDFKGMKSDIVDDLTEVDGRLKKLELGYSPDKTLGKITPKMTTFVSVPKTTSVPPSAEVIDAVPEPDNTDPAFYEGDE